MALIRSDRLYTVEEYFALDEQSQERLEYVNGEIVAMAGETRQHNDVVSNMVAELLAVSRAKGCRLHHQSIKLMIPPEVETPERKGVVTSAKRGRYYYPDLMIACSPEPDDLRLERDPCFVVEVLSPSTAALDRGDKMDAYLRLPSLEAYAIVHPNHHKVSVYRRTPQGWLFEMLEQLTNALEIPCIQTGITLAQIYAGLKVKEGRQWAEDEYRKGERSRKKVMKVEH